MRSHTSTRWLWLVAALAAGLTWPTLVQADTAERGQTSSPAATPTAAHGDFARRVAIRGGRKLYLECRGTGSPTVVLEAGTGDLADVWSLVPSGPGRAVLPAVARFALLRAAHVPGPLRAGRPLVRRHGPRLYATTHARRIAGLVSIDAQNEDFAAAYKELLTPEQ